MMSAQQFFNCLKARQLATASYQKFWIAHVFEAMAVFGNPTGVPTYKVMVSGPKLHVSSGVTNINFRLEPESTIICFDNVAPELRDLGYIYRYDGSGNIVVSPKLFGNKPATLKPELLV